MNTKFYDGSENKTEFNFQILLKIVTCIVLSQKDLRKLFLNLN